ncbi:hypothetical protein GOODEAATRI_011870 [Goodea atripinnis]|uniref:Ubiquinone biosynthesis protein COQ9 HTH domain-containing protein n=1 Tax=Goodea atripinnis TaxID=208336 RepID=A0ABV0N2S2_9TELE
MTSCASNKSAIYSIVYFYLFDFETEEQRQTRILTAAVEFVPLHGWSMEAIAAGAEVRFQNKYGLTAV